MNEVIITNIFWRRTYLFIEFESNKDIELSIVQTRKNKTTEELEIKKQHVLETKKLENNKYRSKINITIAEGRQLLDRGKWTFIYDNNLENTPKISNDILFHIEEFSKAFPYTGKFYAYVLFFNICKKIDQESMIETYSLSMHSLYYRKNFNPYKRQWSEVRNARSLKSFIHKISIRVAKKLLNLYYQIISRILPKNGKKILFMSENREYIMDNLKAIDKRIKERGLDKEYKISYSFRNIFKSKKQNPFSWLVTITKIAKQDYIFVDDYVPVFSFLNLNKKTTLTQVWHAGFGFKLVGFGRFGIDGSPHPVESCHRKYTYGLVGNNNLKEIYSEVWGIEKESLLATGMPRLEHFLDKDVQDKVKEKLYSENPEFKGKKIINFAPTYRGSNQYNAYYDYSKLDFDKLSDFCKKNNAIILFSRHHFLTEELPLTEENKKYIFDISKYSLNDTFYITDILVTDYSSCFYDFLLLKRPVIFYTYDLATYSATRGVHRPVKKVSPGPICETFDELLNELEKANDNNFEIKDFLIDKCVANDQLASDKVIDYIILHKDVNDL